MSEEMQFVPGPAFRIDLYPTAPADERFQIMDEDGEMIGSGPTPAEALQAAARYAQAFPGLFTPNTK